MAPFAPNIIAIIGRNEHGQFIRIEEPVALHREPMVNFIPKSDGVVVVLGLIEGDDHTTLSGMMNALPYTETENNPIFHS